MSYRNHFKNTIKCYDCHQQVQDIKAHRKLCSKSRYAKSAIDSVARKKSKRSRKDTTDVFMLIDVSGSMDGTRLDNAKNTLTNIVDKDMKEDDRISIVSFDTKAYFKLKPRPVGQILRQKELPDILARIFAKGMTAIWDAIHMTVMHIRDKNKKTIIICLTDGQDNSSKHSYKDVLALIKNYPNITLSIVHIGDSIDKEYKHICTEGRGEYIVITEKVIVTEVTRVFNKFYLL